MERIYEVGFSGIPGQFVELAYGKEGSLINKYDDVQSLQERAFKITFIFTKEKRG